MKSLVKIGIICLMGSSLTIATFANPHDPAQSARIIIDTTKVTTSIAKNTTQLKTKETKAEAEKAEEQVKTTQATSTEMQEQIQSNKAQINQTLNSVKQGVQSTGQTLGGMTAPVS